jgi:hypothetical protein
MAGDAWELRTARLEGAYQQIDRCLGAVEGRLSTLEHKMDAGFAQIRAEIRASHSEFRAEVAGPGNAPHSEIVGFRNDLHSEITRLRTELLSRMDWQFSRADRQFYWLLGMLWALILVRFLLLGLKLTGQ